MQHGKGWSALVEISWNHNHDTETAVPLSLLPVDDDVSKEFRHYFAEFQMGPCEAERYGIPNAKLVCHFYTPVSLFRHHQSVLELSEDFSEKLLANSHLNLTARQVRHLFDNWRWDHFGERCSVGLAEKLSEKIPDYAQSGVTVSFVNEPFAIVILTPLMKRAHELEEAKWIAFVDTTSCCDSASNAITFLFAPCSVGAVPLGVIITKNEDSASYTAGFQQLRELLGSAGFGERGYPAFFVTDESAAEKNALSIPFPGKTEHPRSHPFF